MGRDHDCCGRVAGSATRWVLFHTGGPTREGEAAHRKGVTMAGIWEGRCTYGAGYMWQRVVGNLQRQGRVTRGQRNKSGNGGQQPLGQPGYAGRHQF